MHLIPRIVALLLGLAVLLLFLGAAFDRVGTGWRTAPETEQGSRASTSAGAPSVAGGSSQTTKAPGETEAGPKHILLAPEQAEQQRLASLEQKQHAIDPAAAPPPAPTKLYYRVKVRDADTLEAGPTVITLDGIKARPPDASCTDADGKDWPCGAEAKLALSKFIRYRAVSCALPQGGEQPAFASRCRVGNTDLSTWMVREGWALPEPGAEPPLADAADAAKHDHLGIWRSTE